MNEATLSVFTTDTAFDRALRLAEVMAEAKTLPKHLAGSPGDCLRVVELAMRTNQSPYALADKTFLVGGKIAFEGQLCAALLNASPLISRRLDYEYTGEGKTLECIVSGVLAGEEKPRTVKVEWQKGFDQSPSNKDIWKRQPEQQLAYWGARVWGRRHAPEILMGIYTPDEIEAQEPMMRNVTPRPEPTAPALPPVPSDTPEPAATPKAAIATLRDNAELHDALIESLESADIMEGDFIEWINETGKGVPEGGYQYIRELPVKRVQAALANWEKIATLCSEWTATA